MGLNDGGFRSSNFGQPQKTAGEEPLSLEKVEEFKSFVETLNQKIEINYGRIRLQERINVERFNKTISSLDKCIAEGTLVITENKTRKYVDAVKVKYGFEPDGEEALASLKVALNEKLKVPWLKRVHLFDFPFEVATRELDDKKCIEMTHTFRNSKHTAAMRLIIREI